MPPSPPGGLWGSHPSSTARLQGRDRALGRHHPHRARPPPPPRDRCSDRRCHLPCSGYVDRSLPPPPHQAVTASTNATTARSPTGAAATGAPPPLHPRRSRSGLYQRLPHRGDQARGSRQAARGGACSRSRHAGGPPGLNLVQGGSTANTLDPVGSGCASATAIPRRHSSSGHVGRVAALAPRCSASRSSRIRRRRARPGAKSGVACTISSARRVSSAGTLPVQVPYAASGVDTDLPPRAVSIGRTRVAHVRGAGRCAQLALRRRGEHTRADDLRPSRGDAVVIRSRGRLGRPRRTRLWTSRAPPSPPPRRIHRRRLRHRGADPPPPRRAGRARRHHTRGRSACAWRARGGPARRQRAESRGRRAP